MNFQRPLFIALMAATAACSSQNFSGDSKKKAAEADAKAKGNGKPPLETKHGPTDEPHAPIKAGKPSTASGTKKGSSGKPGGTTAGTEGNPEPRTSGPDGGTGTDNPAANGSPATDAGAPPETGTIDQSDDAGTPTIEIDKGADPPKVEKPATPAKDAAPADAGGAKEAAKPADDAAFDEGKITGTVEANASVNFEDIPVGGDQDHNDGNLCIMGPKDRIFKVDEKAKTIVAIKGGQVEAKIFMSSCNVNFLRVSIKHTDGSSTDQGETDPRKKKSVLLDFKPGDQLNVDLLVDKGRGGNKVFKMKGDQFNAARITAGSCQVAGNGCGGKNADDDNDDDNDDNDDD